jgi:DNA-binding NtrC family response regulator
VRTWFRRTPKVVAPASILIVDGSDSNRAITARQVQALGYEVLQTATIANALKVLEEHDPRFVLLGFDLEDAAGLDALQQLRELDPQLVIIMLAADLWDGRTAEAMRKGAVAYLARPFSQDDLRELLGRQ